MGSEGRKSVIINVTGFTKFEGVAENPTETIVNNLRNYVATAGLLPPGINLRICMVLETAGDGAISTFYKVMQSGISTGSRLDNEKIVWLHLGVNNGGLNFSIERQAVNEASFCCPDELGWQPQQLPIILGDGGIHQIRRTSCPIEAIQELLRRKGFDVTISNDAGRFVCNFVYYHSLRYAEQKGHNCLFVHLPPFSRIDEANQMQFILALLEAIASTC
ncbi:pyroglutamyl-peptidase 1 [Olea europaea subsp. europaea]|uniref:Pyroglutamyl-peptidase I n=1 Tax=Olea europaea subsp. europaea TaxID=158383 RepID=A0A8S0QRS6_OLEEU|nr:pyroglutamyl-peptidase 1 [Olea europaea subsp. europaea]